MGAIDVVAHAKHKVLEEIWESLKQTVHPDQLVFQMEYVRKEKFIAFLGGVMDMEAAEQRKKAIAFAEWISDKRWVRNGINSEIYWYRITDMPNAQFKTMEELYNIWENDRKGTA